MNACREFELLVSLRASGAPDALDGPEAARLDAHLAACPACRAELDASSAALSLARLPPPSEAERRAVRDLPARTLAALRGRDRDRGLGRRALVGFAGVAVAAGLAVAVVAPALFRKPQGVPISFVESQPADPSQDGESWQGPDLDMLWSDAQVVDFDGSSSSAGSSDGDTSTDAALAALDY